MPIAVKSSEVRSNLTDKLKEVWQTGEPLRILSDGKTVALLTMEEPKGIPPLAIPLKDAREGWSDLLLEVSQMRARYCFRVRFRELPDGEPAPRIYLVPTSNRNRFHDEWLAHKQEHRAARAPTLTIQEQVDELKEAVDEGVVRMEDHMDEQLKLAVESIKRTFGLALAGLTRPNGNLYATPELGVVPLRSVRDLAPDVDNSR